MNLEPKVLIPVPKKNVEEREFIPVPLPTEVPEFPSLHQLPSHVLHSGTVETLIGQNEDLMARLKVNIRRNSLLEQRINQLDQELRDSLSRADALETERMVVEEKRKQQNQLMIEHELRAKEMREELTLTEIRFAELHKKYTRAHLIEQNFDEHQARQKNLRKRLLARVRRVGVHLRKSIDRLTHEKEMLLTKNKTLEHAREESTQLIYELTGRLQAKEISTREDLKKLTDHYEGHLSATRDKNLVLTEKLLQLETERESLLFQLKDKDTLENRLVTLEREISQEKEKTVQVQAALGLEVEKFRRDSQRLLIENQSLTQKNRKFEMDSGELIKRKQALEEDHESLQIVFQAKSRECQALEKKIDQLRMIQHEMKERLKSYGDEKV